MGVRVPARCACVLPCVRVCVRVSVGVHMRVNICESVFSVRVYMYVVLFFPRQAR